MPRALAMKIDEMRFIGSEHGKTMFTTKLENRPVLDAVSIFRLAEVAHRADCITQSGAVGRLAAHPRIHSQKCSTCTQ